MVDKTGTVMGEKILETRAVNGNPNENMVSISAAHDCGDLNVTSPTEMVPEKNLDEVGITSHSDLINETLIIVMKSVKKVGMMMNLSYNGVHKQIECRLQCLMRKRITTIWAMAVHREKSQQAILRSERKEKL
ncbi:hypothetical protein ACLOJK_014551 [Asimina triloba]